MPKANRKINQQTSEENYRIIFELSPDAIVIHDGETLQLINPAGVKMLGAENAEELMGKPIGQFILSESHNSVSTRFEQPAQGQTLPTVTEKLIRVDGSVLDVEVSINPYRYRGEPASLLFIRDITERKQAELAIRRSESRFQQATQLAGLGIWDWDATTDRVEWSGDMFRIYGVAPEDFTGNGSDYFEFTRADYREIQQANVAKAFEHGITEADLMAGKGIKLNPKELCIVRPNGTECYTLGDAVSIVDENGKPLRMLGVTQDITERREAENTQVRLTAILEATPDFVATADPQQNITYLNQAGRKMIGIGASEDIRGLKVGDLNPDWATAIIKQGFEFAIQHGIWTGETARLTRDGREFPVQQVVIAHKNADGVLEYLSTICRDITESKRAEEKIRRQLDHLTALSEIDRAITSTVDLSKSLKTLLRHVTRQLNVDAADAILFDENTQTLKFLAGTGFRSKNIRNFSMNIHEGYAGRVVTERRMVKVTNLFEEPQKYVRANLLADDAFVSYFGVPLIAKGQIKGLLEVFHRTPLQPDEEWLDFLNALAEQAAIAVDNALLFNDLHNSKIKLEQAYDTTLDGWSRALDLRDKETEGHTRRVTELTLKLAQKMGFSTEQLVQIKRGGLLHDIGKMGIPDSILLKPGTLTDDEWIVMRKHTTYAYEMLSPIEYLRPALDIPYCHHEHWDGSGYPRGLKGEEIPLVARIFSVVDVWDALRSDRPYRKAWAKDEVLHYISSLKDRQFDPIVVHAFLEEIEL